MNTEHEDNKKMLAELSQSIHLPDSGSEKTICWFTTFACIFFIASAAYYVVASREDALKSTLLTMSVGVFVVGFLTFVVMAFRGKMCGCKK